MEPSREDLICDYIELLQTWNIKIDHEDASTALVTALAMEDICSKL